MVLVAADIPPVWELEDQRGLTRTRVKIPRMGCWPPGARAIAALSLDGCHWPVGEVADDDFTFCGSPRQRGSYCAHHAALARAGRR